MIITQKVFAIVILNWNGRNFLDKFLPSVIAHSKGAKIVVADNGSTDDSVELLNDNFKDQVETIVLDQNYGVAG